MLGNCQQNAGLTTEQLTVQKFEYDFDQDFAEQLVVVLKKLYWLGYEVVLVDKLSAEGQLHLVLEVGTEKVEFVDCPEA